MGKDKRKDSKKRRSSRHNPPATSSTMPQMMPQQQMMMVPQQQMMMVPQHQQMLPQQQMMMQQSAPTSSSDSSSSSEGSGSHTELHKGASSIMKLPLKRLQQVVEAVEPLLDCTVTANMSMTDLAKVVWLTTRVQPTTKTVQRKANGTAKEP